MKDLSGFSQPSHEETGRSQETLASEQIVDPELRDLLPPLKDDESKLLEQDIVEHGCRDPLVTWNGILVDGYRRLEICRRREIPYEVAAIELPDREAAMIWRLKIQVARRNLKLDPVKLILGRLLDQEKQQGRRTDLTSRQDGGKLVTAERLGKEFGVSQRTLERDAADYRLIADDPDAQRAIMTGVKTFKDVRFQKKRAETIAGLEDVKRREILDVEGLFDVIVIDPPWSRKKEQGEITPEELMLAYLTMTLEEIANLKLPCADDCHVFLWVTQGFLFEVPALLERWGLRFRTLLIWHKEAGAQPTGLPRYNFEPVVYATKGSPSFVDWKDFDACFNAPTGEPSAKPGEFHATLRRVTAGRRLDMFNRRPITGFEGWGNEAGTHKAL